MRHPMTRYSNGNFFFLELSSAMEESATGLATKLIKFEASLRLEGVEVAQASSVSLAKKTLGKQCSAAISESVTILWKAIP